ncbi:MAG: hypothetical protein J7497_03280 [Chitinophagaceae bacterium]|nr:hypothetical protein [Chitinophagaceae bacterium]
MRIQIICLLIVLSVTAFSQAPFRLVVTDTEAGLIPEGIAYDPTTNSIYISSIQKKKIVRIDKNGR